MLNIDNESTHNLDATVALGGPEAVQQPEDPVYNCEGTRWVVGI